MNETKILADFLSGLRYDQLPPNVVDIAKLCVLDTVGVAIGATTWKWSEIVFDTLMGGENAYEASIWGRPAQGTARTAALINGTAAHGIEMDDRVPRASVHPGCYAVPAALAIAEKVGTSGQELVTSVVSGYELGLRIGLTMGMRRGLHRTGHKGVWLAVGAAARGLDLGPQQMADAFGIAGSMASGLVQFSQDPSRTMVKRLHGGFAAHNGVLAAELAANEFTGPSAILEGEFGYCRTYGRDGEEPRWEELTKDLGAEFRIVEREVKPYASWGGSHNAIDAVERILAQCTVAPEDIESVRIGSSRRAIDAHDLARPESIMAAQYSLPFVTALALARGPGSLVDPIAVWTDETLQDPSISRLVDMTTLEIDPEFEELSVSRRTFGGARVTIVMKGGEQLEEVVFDSRGTTGNPMSREDIEMKFRVLAGRQLSPKRVESIVDMAASVDQIDDVRQLGMALRNE